MHSNKKKINSKVVKIIIDIFIKNKNLTVLLFIVIIGTIIFSLATPQILKYIIDDYLIKKEMTKKLERTPIESLGMELQNIQQSIAGIYRIGEFLKEKEEIKKILH